MQNYITQKVCGQFAWNFQYYCVQIWRIFVEIFVAKSLVREKLSRWGSDDPHTGQTTPVAFDRVTHTRVNSHRRCWFEDVIKLNHLRSETFPHRAFVEWLKQQTFPLIVSELVKKIAYILIQTFSSTLIFTSSSVHTPLRGLYRYLLAISVGTKFSSCHVSCWVARTRLADSFHIFFCRCPLFCIFRAWSTGSQSHTSHYRK